MPQANSRPLLMGAPLGTLFFSSKEAADLAVSLEGWVIRKEPDGTVLHFCPECKSSESGTVNNPTT